MTDDILSQAVRALREETESEDASLRFTRARVMASVHRSHARRGLRSVLLVPLAAVLAGSTAWGAASGKLPEAFRSAVRLVVGSPELAPAEPAPVVARRAAPPASAPVEPEPLPFDPAALEEEPGDRDGEPTLEEHAPVAAPPVRAVPLPSARRAPLDPEGSVAYAAYRRAHDAHFAAQDAAAALAGWDEYLAVAPRGRFALEARYNRALCLVRLGRSAEARAALAPFAAGAHGEYRRREARELVMALDGVGGTSAGE